MCGVGIDGAMIVLHMLLHAVVGDAVVGDIFVTFMYLSCVLDAKPDAAPINVAAGWLDTVSMLLYTSGCA